MRRLTLFSILAISMSATCFANDISDPDALRDLARSGAPEFALSYVNEAQRTFVDEHYWVETEQLRLELYKQLGNWTKLANRELLFDDIEFIPPEMRAAAKLSRAEALVNLKQYTAASEQLDALEANPSLFEFADKKIFDELNIKVLLANEEFAAAQAILSRVVSDDEFAAKVWSEQLAFAEIRLNMPLSVPPEKIKRGAILHAYQWISLLQQESIDAQVLLGNVESMLAEGVPRKAEPMFVAAGALAARKIDAPYVELGYLEQLLSLRQDIQNAQSLVGVSIESLWNQYERLGVLALTNTMQDQEVTVDQIFTLALQAGVSSPPKQRAMLSSLLVSDSEYRDISFEHFSNGLIDEDKDWLLVRLFDADNADLENIPSVASLNIANALLKYNLGERAAKVMLTLNDAPEDFDQFAWDLQRARIFVRYGQLQQGVILLNDLFGQSLYIDEAQAARAMQVGFDLQMVSEHDSAINLFSGIYGRAQDIQIKRELLFWMADSYRATADHEQASRLYLKSATLDNPFAFDPWAQTARFQAAESLMEAGYLTDARSIFNGLYRATKNSSRRATIRQKLDTLSLLEAQ